MQLFPTANSLFSQTGDRDFSYKTLKENAKSAIGKVKPSAIKEELQKSAENFHIIGAWAAIIFNPVFGITDYINIPENWTQVFIIRLFVSLITLVALMLYKQNKISTYLLVTIPFALISLQNAYTYYLISPEALMGHNLNYLALFMGAGLFLLWPLSYSITAIGLSAIATYLFVEMNDALSLSTFAVDGGLLLGTGSIFTILLVHARFRLRSQEIKSRLALNESLRITAEQKEEISGKNERLEAQAEELTAAKQSIETMNLKLQDYNRQLEEKVSQRTQKLKKSNEEMDQLVYSLSHDFRTPMVNVQGLLQLAESEEDLQRIKQIIPHMQSSMNRFDELLHDMSNYSVYWREDLKKEDIDLKEVLEESWNEFRNHHQGEMNFEIKIDEQAATLISDREKLKAVLYSIISNAIKFRKDGQPGSLRISSAFESEKLSLTFEDDGSGIHPQSLPRVCEMFYRGDKRSMGAGMGLYIADRITRQLNGELKVSSELGQGTKVKINLPCK